jgi:hypothetical protein
MDGWRLPLFTRTCPAKSFVVRHASGHITISSVCSSGERATGALNRIGRLENVSFCSYRMKWLAVPIGQVKRESGSESRLVGPPRPSEYPQCSTLCVRNLVEKIWSLTP